MLAPKNLVLFFLSILVIMSSSNLYAHKVKGQSEHWNTKQEPKVVLEPIVVRVTGYGAYESKEDAKSESKRLMVKRASKLDAYRTLAERLYGIGISGGSSVDEFVLKSDGYDAVVDSYVRGARVVSIIENKDRGFETVLEVLLPGDFHECINKVNNLRFDKDCHMPLPMTGGRDISSSRQTSSKMQSIYYLN
jgi:hypothetical protein